MEEKLREQINSVLHSYIIRNIYETQMIEPEQITDQILALIKKAGYLLVEPVQLEVLGDEERMNVDIPCEVKCKRTMPLFDSECMDCMAICHQKAIIIHSEKKGQLYRRVG